MQQETEWRIDYASDSAEYCLTYWETSGGTDEGRLVELLASKLTELGIRYCPVNSSSRGVVATRAEADSDHAARAASSAVSAAFCMRL